MLFFSNRDDCAAQSWIHALQASLSSASHVPDHVIMMLSALLMTSTHTVVMDILKIIPTVAKSNPSQVGHGSTLLFWLCKVLLLLSLIVLVVVFVHLSSRFRMRSLKLLSIASIIPSTDGLGGRCLVMGGVTKGSTNPPRRYPWRPCDHPTPGTRHTGQPVDSSKEHTYQEWGGSGGKKGAKAPQRSAMHC